jgi:hypothetical protein
VSILIGKTSGFLAILHLAAAVMAATEKEFGECGISLVRQV